MASENDSKSRNSQISGISGFLEQCGFLENNRQKRCTSCASLLYISHTVSTQYFNMADYYPTPVDAVRILKFKRAGILNYRIAEIMRMTLDDLEKFYPVELGFTDEEDLAVIADVAYIMASSGQDSAMTKWWLSVKGGWNPNTPPVPTDQSPLLIVLADGSEYEGQTIEDAEFSEVPSDPDSDQ